MGDLNLFNFLKITLFKKLLIAVSLLNQQILNEQAFYVLTLFIH